MEVSRWQNMWCRGSKAAAQLHRARERRPCREKRTKLVSLQEEDGGRANGGDMDSGAVVEGGDPETLSNKIGAKTVKKRTISSIYCC